MSRTFKRERGFLTFAQNGPSGDYVRMAYALALSLKATQKEAPHLSVVVTPGTEIPDRYRRVFDEVIDVPWLDEAKHSDWKLENEWKAFHITPYEETVKLDADMLFLSDISEWWSLMSRQEVMAATTVHTYREEIVTSTVYRETFVNNGLPNVYSAFTFFRAGDFAQEIFEMMELIYHNWERFTFTFMDETRPRSPNTDVALALAIKLTDNVHLCTPSGIIPTFVHMKSKVQNWPRGMAGEKWTDHISVTFSDDLELKIGRHRQRLPFHYHDKSFLTDEIIEKYERALGL